MDLTMASVKGLLLNPSAMFNSYASLYGNIMLLNAMASNTIPPQIRIFLRDNFEQWLSRFRRNRKSTTKTIIIEELWGVERSQLYDAATLYLPTRISPKSLTQIKMGKIRSQKNLSVAISENQTVVDKFNNINITWQSGCSQAKTNYPMGDSGSYQISNEKRYFQLSFDSVHEEMITSTYLQHVMNVSASLAQEDKALKIFACHGNSHYNGGKNYTYLQHPASFDTIAMDPELKRSIIDDLDKFMSRKDYYKRIGKAWKRGYLLHGPPGTGKSSLVVAMAKYLKYDVYDLDLRSVASDSQLRDVFLSMSSKSILVIEDVDCYEEVHARSKKVSVINPIIGDTINPQVIQLDQNHYKRRPSCTLSGILNAIDGLWSGCGEERIIVFTTNHKDKIDPALLRPGRMDMHIELSYLQPSAFPALAFNYLGIRDGEHPFLDEIKGLLETTEVTPASVAEEFLRSDEDVDAALKGVVNLLKRKREEEVDNGGGDHEGTRTLEGNVTITPQSKRMKKNHIIQ